MSIFSSSYSNKDIKNIIKELHYLWKKNTIILFDGSLGSGKTTFIKELAIFLGSKDIINSPTYSYVNRYKINNSLSIFHYDLYRINNISELYDIGFLDDLENNNGIMLIEWPNIALKILSNRKFLTVKIDYSIETINKRNINIE